MGLEEGVNKGCGWRKVKQRMGLEEGVNKRWGWRKMLIKGGVGGRW